MVGRTRPRLLLDGAPTIVSDSFRWRDLLRDPWVEQDAVAAHLERGSVNHGKAHPLQYTKAQYGVFGFTKAGILRFEDRPRTLFDVARPKSAALMASLNR